MRRRSLTVLANTVCRWPRVILLIGVVVAAIAGILTACFLQFKTSRNDLIGRDSDYWHHYSEYAAEFHAEEDYILVVESGQPAQNRAAIDALAAALLSPANNPAPGDSAGAQSFTNDDLYYRINLDKLKPWFLYYLSVDDLKQIQGSIKDFKQLVAILEHRPTLDSFFDTMNRMMLEMNIANEAKRRQMESFLPTVTAIVGQMATIKTNDEAGGFLSPWANAFFSPDMIGQAEEQMQWQGYQTFRKGQMFLLLVHPRVLKGTPEALHEATIPKLRRIMAQVQTRFPEVKINLTGEPVLDYDEMVQSQNDATKATILTLVLICILFAIGFREVLRPLMAVITMVMVLASCMGYATLSVGHLNIITVTFAVMILGLGIDLGIQFIARYEEELKKTSQRMEAIRLAIHHTGPSIITAGVTNAAAFFAMGLSGFRGVIELGIIAGGGMLIATVATMTILPALLLLVYRKGEATKIPAQSVAARFEQLLVSRSYLVVAVCGILMAGALVVGWRVKFDYNVLDLQSKGLASVETELRLLKADVESTLFAAIVCKDLPEARSLQERLSKLPTVAAVHSIAELIPEQQAQKVGIIADIKKELGTVQFVVPPHDPADTELVLRSLASLRLHADKLLRAATERGDATSQAALKPLVEAVKQTRATLQALPPETLETWLEKYERQFYADLESQMQLITGQSEKPMDLGDVPQEVRQMLVGRTGKFLVRVFPKENIWEREALVRFVNDIRGVAPNVTGTPLGLFEFIEILKTGYCKAALWALLVITILIFIDFRGGYATLLTILPLLVGIAWMLGVMAVARIDFNPANIMVLPLIVGIGVAYGIYVVQRYRESHEATFYSKSTGRAVVLSALTSMFAFASLLIGAHRGIRSLGLVMTIGIIACLIAALALLPALLETARRKGWKV